jgi:hypothetical protein
MTMSNNIGNIDIIIERHADSDDLSLSLNNISKNDILNSIIQLVRYLKQSEPLENILGEVFIGSLDEDEYKKLEEERDNSNKAIEEFQELMKGKV